MKYLQKHNQKCLVLNIHVAE